MARVYFNGFETGDFSECAGSSTGTSSVQSAVVRTGAYAVLMTTGASAYRESKIGLNLTSAWMRVYFYLSANPSTKVLTCEFVNSSDSTIACITVNTNGTWNIRRSVNIGTDVGTSSGTLLLNNWNLIQFRLVIHASAGIIEGIVNGETVTATSQNTSGANIDRAGIGPDGVSAGTNFYYDDWAIDDAAYPGDGRILARQWLSTTPTYDSWTKSNASTIDTVWNDTPFSAATSANSGSITTALAQTGDVASFSTIQAGHGGQIIGPSDTINGIKVGVIAKTSAVTSSGGLGSVRLRIAAADTDTDVTLTVSDAYYESAIQTNTLTNLNSAEGGFNKRVSGAARTQTVEDAWMLVEYAPFSLLMPQGIM